MAIILDQITVGEHLIYSLQEDPRTGLGTPALVGTIAMVNVDDSGTTGEAYLKVGVADTAWRIISTSVTSQIITLTQDMIDNKSVELSEAPSTELSVQLVPEGGPPQFPGEDFSVAGNIITWDSLGLDGFLDIGDKLLVYYRV